jgi:hypothetical protein
MTKRHSFQQWVTVVVVVEEEEVVEVERRHKLVEVRPLG